MLIPEIEVIRSDFDTSTRRTWQRKPGLKTNFIIERVMSDRGDGFDRQRFSEYDMQRRLSFFFDDSYDLWTAIDLL